LPAIGENQKSYFNVQKAAGIKDGSVAHSLFETLYANKHTIRCSPAAGMAMITRLHEAAPFPLIKMKVR
jgi:hypothetical protein